MKERPILFSGPMVRAILDGRKTQTRRPVKPQPFVATPSMFDISKCPFGQPGDRLWVRETWGLMAHHDPTDWHRGSVSGASEDAITPMFGVEHRANWKIENENAFWRPSIHMPLWASRITLEIVRVRVERVGDITRGDAMAEGCPFANMAKGPDPRVWFSDTWQSIYGTWEANPWVWAVEFRRVKP